VVRAIWYTPAGWVLWAVAGDFLCWDKGGPDFFHLASVATLDVGGNISIHVGLVVALGGTFLGFLKLS